LGLKGKFVHGNWSLIYRTFDRFCFIFCTLCKEGDNIVLEILKPCVGVGILLFVSPG
jgi:hypothetical protein